ncbi:methyl-accepting chemotaxis protein [uncultured Pelagimonas sp.]|uniref:methyl-accepting chemotaxis protein n=1 Tax=uncultured Pelagimonas sp. TaxID=1618102 RepID=UPI0026301194|nr:methyl-accepting chemotaxis protein [uncultured Pelagimonas sp.]
MKWFANWPIRRKLLVPGLSSLLVLVLVITFFWAMRYSQALNDAFAQEIQLIETYVSPPLASAAWNFDDELAQNTLLSFSDYKGFVFATLMTDGSAMAEHTLAEAIDPTWAQSGATLIESGELRTRLGNLEIIRTPLVLDGNNVGDLVWGVDVSIISEAIFNANKTAALIGVISYIAFAGVLFLISTSVAGPMTRVVRRLEELQQGNTDVDIPEVDRRDEVGSIGKALANLRDGTIEKERLAAERAVRQKKQMEVVEQLSENLSSLAQGDLTAHISMEFPPQYEQLKNDFNATSKQLRETVSAVVDSARDIHARAAEITGASDDLARRTETQAATLEQTAAALDQLTVGLKNTADGATTVSNSMQETKEAAEQGGQVVGRTVSAMGEIESSSEHISQIIGVIDDIAFQTNLLALNAGVEAARAGKAGVGFSVVASEVQNLAQRSAEAATEIKTLIEASTDHVNNGVTLVGETGSALNHIVTRINAVFTLNTDISEGTQNQSLGISEVNTAMVGLDQVTQQNAAMVEEATAASHAMTESATNLLNLVSQFRTASEECASPSGEWDQEIPEDQRIAS